MTATAQRYVEHHMGTVVTLFAPEVDEVGVHAFFARVAELEDLLSRFRPNSQLSRLGAGELDLDHAEPRAPRSVEPLRNNALAHPGRLRT